MSLWPYAAIRKYRGRSRKNAPFPRLIKRAVATRDLVNGMEDSENCLESYSVNFAITFGQGSLIWVT